MYRGDYRLLPKGLRRMLVFSETFFFQEHGKAAAEENPAGGVSQDLLLAGVLRVAAARTISRNANRASGPGLGANECVPSGKWCKSTAFRHCARSSKRTVRLISGVALDECLDPERYRTRGPLLNP